MNTYAENKAELMGAKLVLCADTKIWYAHLGEPIDLLKNTCGTGETPEMALLELELILLRDDHETMKDKVEKLIEKLSHE